MKVNHKGLRAADTLLAARLHTFHTFQCTTLLLFPQRVARASSLPPPFSLCANLSKQPQGGGVDIWVVF